MKKNVQLTLLLLFIFSAYTPLLAQCPTSPAPDFSYCYGSNETDVVAFEVCGAGLVTAAICQGDFEAGFDDLTVYEGATGSGTGGTIVFGPADGDLTGTTISSTTAGNCLIFVSNSDGSVSCASGSRPTLDVYLNSCPAPPTYDGTYCYGSNETDVVAFEFCGAANEILMAAICQGDFEAFFDDLTVYEGASGSGTTGNIVFGPADGDLTGSAISSATAGNCLIFVSNSDGSVSCASGARPTLLASFTTQVVLPVELVSFNGKVKTSTNILQWETASESNTQSFIIERSNFNTDNWIPIGSADAVGFTSQQQRYSFEDHQPLPMSYYRLRIVDYDGYEEYSEIIVLEREDDKRFQVVNISPIPASELVTISYYSQYQDQVSWSLISMTGQVLKQNTVISKGEHTFDIPVNDLSSGIYLFSIETNDERIVKRIIVN